MKSSRIAHSLALKVNKSDPGTGTAFRIAFGASGTPGTTFSPSDCCCCGLVISVAEGLGMSHEMRRTSFVVGDRLESYQPN